MQEIAGATPLNYHVALPQPPVRPQVAEVAAAGASSSSGTATDGRTADRDARSGGADRYDDPRFNRKDPYELTGPPPAFVASLLEVERDFRDELARIEAQRANTGGGEGYGTQPPRMEQRGTETETAQAVNATPDAHEAVATRDAPGRAPNGRPERMPEPEPQDKAQPVAAEASDRVPDIETPPAVAAQKDIGIGEQA